MFSANLVKMVFSVSNILLQVMCQEAMTAQMLPVAKEILVRLHSAAILTARPAGTWGKVSSDGQDAQDTRTMVSALAAPCSNSGASQTICSEAAALRCLIKVSDLLPLMLIC